MIYKVMGSPYFKHIEMARVIVLTSEHWFLLSGTVNSDGRLIVEQHF
jgi:hypothetical protein